MCSKKTDKTHEMTRKLKKNWIRDYLSFWKKIMKKYLDILIFSLLFFLIFSYFSTPVEQEVPNWIIFETSENAYKVPAALELSITNNTSEILSLNTCSDITVRSSWDGELIQFSEGICDDIDIGLRETYNLDLASEFALFTKPGEYIFQYSQVEKQYIQTVEIEYRGTIGKIFVGIFYAPMYNLLAYLIGFFGNSLWIAILAITVLIRIILLFPQHKMMVSQRKMQAIQPKIKKLQEKHKWNQQAMGMELMKLYKTEWVNPMGSCGFLLIQMPFLIVIYHIIINITSLSNAFYLYDFLPEFSISQIQYNFIGIDLLGAGWVTGLLLGLTVAIIQYTQVKLSLAGRELPETSSWVVLEKKKWEDGYNAMMPDPEMMNKIMLYGMPVMVGIFTYTLIAWVWLYWWMSTLFAVFQQLFVNNIIKK